jgi:lysophospholipase L1-like esterase
MSSGSKFTHVLNERDACQRFALTRTRFAKRVSLLAAVGLAVGLVACGEEAPAPVEAGGSGLAAGVGGGAGAAAGTGSGKSGAGGSAGTGTPIGSGGTAGANSAAGAVGVGGSAGAALGGASGSSASGAGGSGMNGGAGVPGLGGRGSAGDSSLAGSATGGSSGMTVGGSGGQSAAGSGGSAACEKGVTKGQDVLLIGDSFIALSRDISKDLNTLARNAGALAASDSYRDNSVSGTQLSGGISPQIPVQYTNGQKQAPAKVVIMDGGGNDMLNNTCSDPPTSSCQGIQNAVKAVQDLFTQMGTDGVESVVYFFYPENQTNATQRAKIDVLRSLLQDVCYSSVSPKCYGVDLRPVFEGHFSEYVLSDGIHPTAAGSQASSDAIWKVMQDNCVAQ